MHIKHKPVAAFYKLMIGAVALLTEWYLMGRYGFDALRLFPTWVLFVAAIYFLSTALILALSHSSESGKNPCPMLEGMLIISFLLMAVLKIVNSEYFANTVILEPWTQWVVNLILPVLVILDWALFVKKGRWRAMGPFYWLALSALYAATMMFTADLMPDSASMRYPVLVLNYMAIGLWPMTLCFLIVFAVELAVGYGFYLVDYLLSGKLAKKIVLPHLQTVIVDENGAEIRREPMIKSTIENSDNVDETDLADDSSFASEMQDLQAEAAKAEAKVEVIKMRTASASESSKKSKSANKSQNRNRQSDNQNNANNRNRQHKNQNQAQTRSNSNRSKSQKSKNKVPNQK